MMWSKCCRRTGTRHDHMTTSSLQAQTLYLSLRSTLWVKVGVGLLAKVSLTNMREYSLDSFTIYKRLGENVQKPQAHSSPSSHSVAHISTTGFFLKTGGNVIFRLPRHRRTPPSHERNHRQSPHHPHLLRLLTRSQDQTASERLRTLTSTSYTLPAVFAS